MYIYLYRCIYIYASCSHTVSKYLGFICVDLVKTTCLPMSFHFLWLLRVLETASSDAIRMAGLPGEPTRIVPIRLFDAHTAFKEHRQHGQHGQHGAACKYM